MWEISISFCIEEKKYRLFVERKIFHFEAYLFQELENGFMRPMKVQKVSASTFTDGAKHWLIGIRLKLRQKMKKKSGKSRGYNACKYSIGRGEKNINTEKE